MRIGHNKKFGTNYYNFCFVNNEFKEIWAHPDLIMEHTSGKWGWNESFVLFCCDPLTWFEKIWCLQIWLHMWHSRNRDQRWHYCAGVQTLQKITLMAVIMPNHIEFNSLFKHLYKLYVSNKYLWRSGNLQSPRRSSLGGCCYILAAALHVLVHLIL